MITGLETELELGLKIDISAQIIARLCSMLLQPYMQTKRAA